MHLILVVAILLNSTIKYVDIFIIQQVVCVYSLHRKVRNITYREVDSVLLNAWAGMAFVSRCLTHWSSNGYQCLKQLFSSLRGRMC